MKTVFLCVPNYIASSDLLRTKYISYLAAKYRVVILTSFLDTDKARAGGYFQSPNLAYEHRPTEHSRFWDFFKSLRISLVNEFDYLISIRYWYRRPNYKNNWKRRVLRFLGRSFSFFLTANFFTKLESLLLPRPKRFLELVGKYKPDLIITVTPGFDGWEAEIILAAKKLKIPTVAVNTSWDNMTMNAKHIRKTDYLIAWNEIIKKEAMTIHNYPSDRIFVSGTPRFDVYFENNIRTSEVQDINGNIRTSDVINIDREGFLKSKGLNPAYKTIFHTTVTKAYPFQKKYIRDLIKLREDKKIPYVNLFIRIHPLDVYDNYKEFLNVPDLCIDSAGKYTDGKVEMSYNDLLNLKYSLKYTDLNINYASTISIEACIFDKPIINIGYIDRFALAYEFNHYRPIYESGAVRLAKSDADLPGLIKLYLDNPKLDSEARQRIVVAYIQYIDGLSYKRSIDCLAKIMDI